MAHTYETREDGLRVVVVGELTKRYDPITKKEVAQRDAPAEPIVHASEIAKYYGIPLRDIGETPGVWSLVHTNVIGQRVPYNTEETRPNHRYIRIHEHVFNQAGLPIDTRERIIENKNAQPIQYAMTDETDDGMYVRLSDLLEYAAAEGWSKGGGWPKHQPVAAPAVDVAAIVAAVLAALGHAPAASTVVESTPKPKRTLSPEHLAAMAAGRAASRRDAANE